MMVTDSFGSILGMDQTLQRNNPELTSTTDSKIHKSLLAAAVEDDFIRNHMHVQQLMTRTHL